MTGAISVDLNCDIGELPGPSGRAADAALIAMVTSANVACGGHAGDLESMEATIRAATARGVAVGAHPSYDDRAGFGRRSRAQTPAEAARSIAAQMIALREVASAAGAVLLHAKPHGALYNDAAVDWPLAQAVADAVFAFDPSLVLVGLAGSILLDAGRAVGLRVAAEGFCDRAYAADGTLQPRTESGSVFEDPDAAARQAVRLATRGDIDTLCIHGDTPGALAIAGAVRAALGASGVRISPLRKDQR